jgi:hypothetical protein
VSLLNPWVWLVALGVLAGAYGTGRWHQYRSDLKDQAEAKLTESESARLRERAQQIDTSRIRDEKDAEIRHVASERDAALAASMRDRRARLSEAARAACAGSTGRELSDRDAAAFIGLAARADTIRAELDACQKREAVTP